VIGSVTLNKLSWARRCKLASHSHSCI